MNHKKMDIRIHGFDDNDTIINMVLTIKEIEFMERLCKMINSEGYNNKTPIMSIQGDYYED